MLLLTFPYYLVGAAIVSALSFANRMLNWQAWILILPVVYMIYRSASLVPCNSGK